MRYLVAAALALVLPIAAYANPMWSCSVSSSTIKTPFLVTFTINGSWLIQTGVADTKGRYDIIQNNLYGVVAVSSMSGILPGDTYPTVGLDAVIIGKKTNEVWMTGAYIGAPPGANEPGHGPCIFTR